MSNHQDRKNMTMEFTPIASTLGGVMIGLSAILLMLFKGRIAGVSGITMRILSAFESDERPGRMAFIAGIIFAPLLIATVTDTWPVITIQTGTTGLIIAGLLVGFGSVLGNGCTSGHGICGISRLSPRSLVAVAIFMTTAAITVFFMRHIL
jgi:uncharacterized protein